MPQAAPGLDSAVKLWGFETFRERGKKMAFPKRWRTGGIPGNYLFFFSHSRLSVLSL